MLTTLRANAWKYTALALGLGLGFALAMQSIRLAEARLETAHAERTLHSERAATAQAALTTSERYRTLEGNYREDLLTVAETYASETRRFMADADRAAAARDSMRRDLAGYIESHRAAAVARAAAGQCAPDTGPLDLLADLQRRADDRAGELARIADDARTRGAECASRYDSARALIEAARHAQAR